MFFSKRREQADERDERAIRRLFVAASSEETPAEPPPFFMTRVRGQVEAERREAAAHPIGAAAWQVLPAAAVVLVLLAGWTGYESVHTARERDAAIANMLEPGSAAGDALLAATFLGGEFSAPGDAGR